MPEFPMRAHQSFPAEARSVAQARSFTRRTLEAWGADELVDTASLIVSELVTNAVVHTGTTARLILGLGTDLRIEVEDKHPGRTLPMVTNQPPDTSEHGRGLMITTSLSASWGVEYTATTKRVWSLCARNGSTAGPSAPVDVPLAVRDAGDARDARVAVVEISADGEVTGWNADASALFGWAADEVQGRPYVDLVDPATGGGPPGDAPAGSAPWQGTYALVCRDASAARVFASHVRSGDHGGTIALVVPDELRALLEQPVVSHQVVHSGPAALGLRDEALVRLSVEEYLTLAAERVRNRSRRTRRTCC